MCAAIFSVFGHEPASVIEKVHPETADWQVGERVLAGNSAPCGECYPLVHTQ